MPGANLERPDTPDELYLARGSEVNQYRPFLQGDVFEAMSIPGLDDGDGLAMILTHPCSMRKGAALVSRQLVARVSEGPHLPLEQWPAGHTREMPLPALLEAEPHRHFSASFEAVGAIQSELLAGGNRIACLDPRGICLLQQRLVFYLTRVEVPTPRLLAVIEPVLAESELMEEWVERAIAHDGRSRESAEESFHEFVRATPSGFAVALQRALEDSTRRAAVRRVVSAEMDSRFG